VSRYDKLGWGRQKRYSRRVRNWSAILAAVGLAVVPPALASTIRDDTPDSDYTSLGAEARYAASGYVVANTEFGSGTLIAPDWILTAAHVVVGSSASEVTFGQGAADSIINNVLQPGPDSVASVVIESGYDGNGPAQGNDLALLQLSSPITQIVPALFYNASLGTPIGQVGTSVGYGKTGTGLTGATLPAGTRRGIQNSIDAFGDSVTVGGTPQDPIGYDFTSDPNGANVSSNMLLTDFDDPATPPNPNLNIMGGDAPLPLEGATAGGIAAAGFSSQLAV
jgi:Trypsin